MTKEELNILAHWMTEVWKTYCKYMQTEMNEWDFDALLSELRIIYENSGNDPNVMDIELGFMDSMERRWKDAEQTKQPSA